MRQFLDNRMRDSRIDGLIDLPYPAQFAQKFAGLRLNCLGGIEGAPLPEPDLNQPLAYWNGRFDALALQFRHDPEDVCNVTNAFLTLGARTAIASPVMRPSQSRSPASEIGSARPSSTTSGRLNTRRR